MGRKPLPITELFWRRVEKTSTCWLWHGPRNRWGYGRLEVHRPNRTRYLAHRLAFLWAGGILTEGDVLMHTCDVRNCVNPAHLAPGTQQQNLADMRAKDRANSWGHKRRSKK